MCEGLSLTYTDRATKKGKKSLKKIKKKGLKQKKKRRNKKAVLDVCHV